MRYDQQEFSIEENALATFKTRYNQVYPRVLKHCFSLQIHVYQETLENGLRRKATQGIKLPKKKVQTYTGTSKQRL